MANTFTLFTNGGTTPKTFSANDIVLLRMLAENCTAQLTERSTIPDTVHNLKYATVDSMRADLQPFIDVMERVTPGVDTFYKVIYMHDNVDYINTKFIEGYTPAKNGGEGFDVSLGGGGMSVSMLADGPSTAEFRKSIDVLVSNRAEVVVAEEVV